MSWHPQLLRCGSPGAVCCHTLIRANQFTRKVKNLYTVAEVLACHRVSEGFLWLDQEPPPTTSLITKPSKSTKMAYLMRKMEMVFQTLERLH